MDLNLKKDIIKEINKKSAVIVYDFPYVLLKNEEESLRSLVDNAPTAYSMEIKESPCSPGGFLILLERLES